MSVQIQSRSKKTIGSWQGSDQDLKFEPGEILETLRDLSKDCFLIDYQDKIAVANSGRFLTGNDLENSHPVAAVSLAISPSDFGDEGFTTTHGIKSAYMAGSMANAISGIELVTSLGKAGFLASYGSGGVAPEKLLDAITAIKNNLPDGPYAFNLIHSPNEPVMEQKAVDLFLEHKVKTVEASAFLRLTPTVVQYRAAGLAADGSGNISINNKIIAKLSRPEVALHFLNPAPEKILAQLVEEGKITAQQAQLAGKVPMADDITVEADSGGHTDNRPLVGLLPSITALRNEIQENNKYPERVRIGAGGGISTPASVLAAFSMGAAYVVTGSVNQGCTEAGTSNQVKLALAQAAAPDVMMAPSADMFEMGVKVQVLKRGTMFPMRSQKLYETYLKYDSINDINPVERQELEQKIFQNDLDSIWQECVKFFSERDPSQLKKAENNPKRKMALIFRWYLGLATHWGIHGIPERVMDYQIWCGPSMGAFNDWARSTDLEAAENRHVVEIADQLMMGAAYQYRLNQLAIQGLQVPTTWERHLGFN
ncbi:MAG: PfaD family polyunsaturated fatty acid/polyketide biosynthesis protein [Anaerolineales bacterium]|nr:PfaD family polyunsaturated fatty acid/polyketide biosynthesis protein [Anaerolineales bacterium]